MKSGGANTEKKMVPDIDDEIYYDQNTKESDIPPSDHVSDEESGDFIACMYNIQLTQWLESRAAGEQASYMVG